MYKARSSTEIAIFFQGHQDCHRKGPKRDFFFLLQELYSTILPTFNTAGYENVYHSSIISQALLKRLTEAQFVLEKHQRNKMIGKLQILFFTTVNRSNVSFKNSFQSKNVQPVKSYISYLPAFFFPFACSQGIWLTTSRNTCPILPVFCAFFHPLSCNIQ